MVSNDGLIVSLDVQLTDSSGRPAKADQNKALIFYFLLFFILLSVLCWSECTTDQRQLFQLGEAQSENSLERYGHMLK